MSRSVKQIYEFGDFRLNPTEQLLQHQGRAVALMPKVFETLVILVQSDGRLIDKEDFIEQLWPGVFVEDVALARNISELRRVLGNGNGGSKMIQTVPKRGYRFVEPVTVVNGVVPTEIAPPARHVSFTRTHRLLLAAAAIVVVVTALVFYFHSFRATKVLAAKDTVVLADFVNSTGDPVFDGTLQRGLAVQLDQSPYLNVVSDSQVADTLRLMEQPESAKLTDELARQVCRRLGAAAVIGGSIANLGSQYVVGLSALKCGTGEILTEQQVTADNKSQVLAALAHGASELRGKLGESLSSIQQNDVPLEQATTPSLEALQAYTLGRRKMVVQGDWVGSIPLFERAISLDPNFAMAQARLGTCYTNLGERTQAVEDIAKAYRLVDRTSGREKIYITSHYYWIVSGDLIKAEQALESGTEIYPQDETNYLTLGAIYRNLGEYDKAVAAARSGLRINPASGLSHSELADAYVRLDRLDEAKADIQESRALGLDPVGEHEMLYAIGFLEHDSAAMAEEVAWAAGKPQYENKYTHMESLTAASSGLLGHSRELSNQAAISAQAVGWPENAAGYRADDAVIEALFGNAARAQSEARAALGISRAAKVEANAALAYVLSGDASQAQLLADDLAKRFPDDTIVQYTELPEIRAEIEIARGNPAQAIQLLEASVPYQFGVQHDFGTGPQCLPLFIRGTAYLEAHDGSSAAAEFQKILDHPGVALNFPIGSLAHLELGRAAALEGDKAKARTAYQDFFALWRHADSDIPILRRAKAEYAKLR